EALRFRILSGSLSSCCPTARGGSPAASGMLAKLLVQCRSLTTSRQGFRDRKSHAMSSPLPSRSRVGLPALATDITRTVFQSSDARILCFSPPCMAFFFALLAFFMPPSPAPTGTVSGRVTLIKNGAPLPDSSNVVVWIEGSHRGDVSAPARAMMKSEKKRFTPRTIVVARRGVVDFPNADAIYHNVFSVSGANRFDLGLYRAGASKEKTFEETGLVRVYCNIHPTMVGFVMVVDSDFSAVTSSDGAFRFEARTAGSHGLQDRDEEVAAEQ